MVSGLPKSSLLRETKEFNRVYRQGRRLIGDGFSVIYTDNDTDGSRLGISVQKKVGNAVRRNRVKRLIREVFRCNRDMFPQQSDIVVTVRPGFSLDHPLTVKKSVSALLKQ